MKNKIDSIDIYGDMIAFSWLSTDTTYIKLKLLRVSCPCAFCSGEKDVFGNTYRGPEQSLNKLAFIVKGYSFIGLYGLKIVWGDGHSDGIYTFNLLSRLSFNNDKE